MPPAGGPARLEVRIEEKQFVGKDGLTIEVLRGVFFVAAAGEFTCLLGPSGCGKTTTLRIIIGLDRDYRGSIVLPGPQPTMAMVFQEPRLLPWRTVEENVQLALPDGRPHQSLEGLFEELGLADMRGRFPGELSLGLARRAALARAFAIEPDLLLMDEPFVSLDPPTAAQMRKLLLRVWRARPTTVVMVTHHLREALELADRLVFLTPRPARVLGELRIEVPRNRRTTTVVTRLTDDVTSRFPGSVERI